MATSQTTEDADLGAYVPAILDDWVRDRPSQRYHAIDGTLLFTDLSGFTALNERLSARGKIGAELMAGVITSVFTELLEVAGARGGDMLKFGGDALLLLFHGDGHLRRAALAASEMQSRLRRVGRIDTGSGVVRLRMSAGLHTGRVDLFLVGESHRDLVCAGPAATATCAMEAVADAGEVLLSRAAATGLGDRWLGQPKGDGVLLGVTPRATALDISPVVRSGFDATRYVPAAVRSHLAHGGHHPEHRLVTVSFVNFQGIDSDLEAERFALVTDRLHAAISHAQDVYDRHEVSFLATDVGKDGTKIMSTTGAPRALGEDEDRMLLAATELVQGDHGLRVHVGVNRGHAFAGDVGPSFRRTYTVLGDTTNTAARVMAKAEAFQVLATPSVLHHATTRFALDVIPPFAAKGKAKPLVAFGVRHAVGRTSAFAGGESHALFGRDAELATLRSALRQTASANGSQVQVVAEPGLGKTRLVTTAVEEATIRQVVSAACGPYGQRTAYFAVRLLLLDALGADLDAPLAELRRRVRRAKPQLLPWMPLLTAVFDEPCPTTPEVDDLAEQFRRPRLHLLLGEILEVLVPGPAAFVVEDVHWADDASTEALTTIAAGLARRPWSLITTRRDVEGGYRADPVDATVLRLDPLNADALRRLARATSSGPLLPSVLDDLLRRSGGNPLFLEELVRAAASGSVEGLPDSIETLLAVRIDRLGPSAKAALRYAAVLGLRVEEDLLREAVADLGVDSLSWEGTEEFVDRRDGMVRFRNALARDAAYEALAFGTRSELHLRAARCYEARGGPVDLIAIHYSRANSPQQAWDYSLEAARLATAKLAHAEAIEFYRMAVAAADASGAVDPLTLSAVWESLGDSCEVAGRYEEAASAYRSSRRLDRDRKGLRRKEGELRERAGRYSDALRWYRRAMHEAEPDERVKLSLAYAGVRLRQGRFDDAVRWAEPALHEAEQLDDESSIAHATYLLHLALTTLGKPDRAAYRARAVPIYERHGDLHALAKALNNLGIEAYYEGDWSDALAYWTRARDAMLRVGDEVGAATLSNNIGEVLSDQGSLAEASELFEEAAEACRAAGYQLVATVALKNSGRVATRARRFDEARALLGQALDAFEQIGASNYATETKMLLAECDVVEGNYAGALERLAAVRGSAGWTPVLEAFALRLTGIARAALGDGHGAREALIASREIARSASAEYEVAVTSLVVADLDGDHDERDDARALLHALGVAEDTVITVPSARL